MVHQQRYFQRWQQAGEPIDLMHAFSVLNTSALLHTLFGVEGANVGDTMARYIADGEETIAYRSKLPWRPALAWLNGRTALRPPRA